MIRHPVRTLRGIPPLRSYVALVQNEARALRMSAIQMISDLLVTPLGYLLLLGGGIAGVAARSMQESVAFQENLAFILPGVIVLQAVGGISNVMYRLQADRQGGLMAYKLVQGIPPIIYVASVFTIPALKFLAQTTILVTASALIGVNFEPATLLRIAIGGLLAALTWSCFGGLLVFTVRKSTNRMTVMMMLNLPLIFGAPTFYAFESMPSYLQAVARFNPLTYQVELIRQTGIIPVQVAGAVAIVLLILAFIALTTLVARAEPLPAGDHV